MDINIIIKFFLFKIMPNKPNINNIKEKIIKAKGALAEPGQKKDKLRSSKVAPIIVVHPMEGSRTPVVPKA
jgi:hypothetical protein